MDKFELVLPYKPTGDQPEAIQKLTEGIQSGLKGQVLRGVTGSGSTLNELNQKLSKKVFSHLPIPN